jgi:hypothetical protein
MARNFLRIASDHRATMLFIATLVTGVFLMWAPVAGAAVTITTCGAVVPSGETGYLTADLDCGGRAVEGVVLDDRAKLIMGGHAIVGDRDGEDGIFQGVRCRTGTVCTVIGPGLISGFSASGIAGTRVRVRDVVIEDNGRNGIAAYENVKLRNVLIGGNAVYAVHAGGRLRARDTTFEHDPDTPAVVEEHAPRYAPTCGARDRGDDV